MVGVNVILTGRRLFARQATFIPSICLCLLNQFIQPQPAHFQFGLLRRIEPGQKGCDRIAACGWFGGFLQAFLAACAR